ncbi:hypothetical protein ACFOM8_10415 [Paracoccus angustae]|uniref:TipAS antibiotic-recognition domain-containing protein n=1 Tax=Paracoccus angustae TaxID=1671480 RepID=A0ABV7U4L8_9RHOB
MTNPPEHPLHQENENPGALAGATGADIEDWLSWVDHNIQRESAARGLMEAVLACDPSDRLELLERFYEALCPGFPIIAFDSLMAEAAFWADRASPAERKAYALACYNRLSPSDQSGFLDYVQQKGAAA